MSDKKSKETKPIYVEKNQLLLKKWKRTKNEDIKVVAVAEVALESKIGQHKSTCLICGSRKSSF